MAIYRNIQVSFWNDSKIIDNFTPEDKYFYLYLFTNPHTNLCGCYEVSIRQIALETGYGAETIERLIERFKDVHKVIAYSRETKEILLLNWHKYNWTGSKDFRKALGKEIDGIKNETYKKYLKGFYDGVETVLRPSLDGVETVPETKGDGGGDGVGTTDTDTDTVSDTDTITDTDTGALKIPTRDEILTYVFANDLNVDVDHFIDYYEATGWMSNGEKIRNWKALIRKWSVNEERPKQDNALSLIDQIVKGVKV